MSALSLRVPVQHGEPAHSLEHRLATRWHMAKPDFLRCTGLPSIGLRDEVEIAALANLAGCDPVGLLAATPRRQGRSRRVLVGATWTDLADVSLKARRFCPECLRSDRTSAGGQEGTENLAPWSRTPWAIRSIRTCPTHLRLLVSRCPGCGKEADVMDPGIDSCRCGSRFSDQEAPGMLDRSDVLLAALIAGSDVPVAFRDVGLSRISSHLERLGAITLGWRDERPSSAKGDHSPLRDLGLDLACHEGRLEHLLDGLVGLASPGRSGLLGLTAAYGWIWRSWLGVPSPNPLDQRLRQRVVEHAAATGVSVQRGRGSVTLTQACSTLRSGHERGRRIVLGTGLASGATLRGVPMSIERAGVEDLASRLSRLLDASSAAARLGVGRMRFRQLARERLVVPDADVEAIGGGRLYDPGGLDALLDAVSASAVPMRRSPAGCLPLVEACRAVSVPLVSAIRAAVDGQLPAVARTEHTGLAGVWFSAQQLKEFGAKRATSVRSAALIMGLHYEAARWLAAQGQFGDGQGLVDDGRIASFAQEYATSEGLAGILGVDRRSVIARLRQLSVEPTFGPPACRQTIWPRAVAIAALTNATSN